MLMKIVCFFLGHKDDFIKAKFGVAEYKCLFCGRARFSPLAMAEQRTESAKFGRLK